MWVNKTDGQTNGENIMGKACQNYSLNISAFFDGELEGDELKELELHLQSCEFCQTDLEGMKNIQAVISAASASSPPLESRSLFKDIMAKVKEEEKEEEAGIPRA